MSKIAMTQSGVYTYSALMASLGMLYDTEIRESAQ